MGKLANEQRIIELNYTRKMVTVPNLSVALASVNALGPSLRQFASIGVAIQAAFEPMRQAIERLQESIRRIMQPIREAIESITKPLSFLLSTRPIYFVPPEPVVLEQQTERHLTVDNDPYGFFLIDGEQLNILHPASSRCGKLLAALLKRRATVVDYKTLQAEIGAGDLDKDFKDLKYQLRQRGYQLDYKRPRTQGIALIGIKELQ